MSCCVNILRIVKQSNPKMCLKGFFVCDLKFYNKLFFRVCAAGLVNICAN